MLENTTEIVRDRVRVDSTGDALTAELAAHRRLHEISCRLIPAHDVGTLYAELIDAAIEIMDADFGTMQALNSETGELDLLEARGLPQRAVEQFARVRPDCRTSCAEALRRHERVYVDYLTDDGFAQTDDGRSHLDAGIRAALSTPLLARSGELVGMLTTHWREAVQPPEWQVRMLDILARQAADLCARHESDEAVRRSEERYRELFSSMTEGFCIIEKVEGAPGQAADFRYVEANPAFAGQAGVGDVVGKTIREVVPGEADEWFEIYDRVATTGEAVRLEREVVTLGRVLELYAFRVGDGARRQVGVVFRDVTGRKRADEALRQSEERYRSLFESIDEGFAVLDVIFDGDRAVDYRFVEVNPAFERQTGLRDACGRTAREMVPELEDHWFETYGRVASTGRPERFVNHARNMDDRWFDVYAFRMGGESSSRVALLFKDITRQRQTMQELAELNRTLEQRVAERTGQVQELATRLTLAEQEERRRIARMLHDGLQQLLYGIHLRLESVVGQMTEPPQQSLRADFEVASDWVSEAIEAARELSLELNPPVLHGEGLAKALDWLAKQMSTKHRLSVQLELDRDVRIQNEDLRSLLFHTTRELLFNVVKHAGVSQATLRLSQQDGHITIEVMDEGFGFDPRTLDDRGVGTGLGLFSVRERLRLIGGTMDIRSEQGSGTRVAFSAPVDGFTDPDAPGRVGSESRPLDG